MDSLKIRIRYALLKTDPISVGQNKPIYAIHTHALFLFFAVFLYFFFVFALCCATHPLSMRGLLQLHHIDKVNGISRQPKNKTTTNSTTKLHSTFS